MNCESLLTHCEPTYMEMLLIAFSLIRSLMHFQLLSDQIISVIRVAKSRALDPMCRHSTAALVNVDAIDPLITIALTTREHHCCRCSLSESGLLCNLCRICVRFVP